jgi:hypothetical protein
MVRIDDPPSMNILGLCLASALRRGEDKGVRGTLVVDAEGMRAAVRFEEDGVTVTRREEAATATVSGPLPLLVRAVARPGPLVLLRLRVRGSRWFALRALRALTPVK